MPRSAQKTRRPPMEFALAGVGYGDGRDTLSKMPHIFQIQPQRRADPAVGQQRRDLIEAELGEFVGDVGVAVQQGAGGLLAEATKREGARVFGGGAPVRVEGQRVARPRLDRVAPAKLE